MSTSGTCKVSAAACVGEAFDFLGHTIVRRRKRGTSKAYVFTFSSAKAMRSIRDRTRELTKNRSTLYLGLDEVLLRLNSSLQGWANYFRHGSSSRHFQQIDYHAWKRINAWIRRKHHPISCGEVRRRFTGPGSRFTFNEVTFSGASSVKIVRYRHRGTKIPTRGPPNRPPHRQVSERDPWRAVGGDESQARFGRPACGNGTE